jgi:hypothetical protein
MGEAPADIVRRYKGFEGNHAEGLFRGEFGEAFWSAAA